MYPETMDLGRVLGHASSMEAKENRPSNLYAAKLTGTARADYSSV